MRCMDALGLGPGDVAALIGCGGKTTLMLALAREARGGKVIVSTTTRMYRPARGAYDRAIAPGEPPGPGINLLLCGADGDGKCAGPPPDSWVRYAAPDTLILLEADGSRGLPTKGWAAHEPVIPPVATATVGVCALWPVGHPMGADTTHRPGAFMALTGLREGERITLRAIADMISGQDGMFARARGRRVLLINQVEDEAARVQARALVGLLPRHFLEGLARAAVGSARNGQCEVLYERDA